MTVEVRALLVESDPAEVAEIKGYLQREAPQILLSTAETFIDAKSQLKSQIFDAVIIAEHLPDSTSLELVQHLKDADSHTAAIVVVESGNYRLVQDLARQGVYRMVFRGDGYRECLPVLIEQTAQFVKALRQERTRTTLLLEIIDALPEGLVAFGKDLRVLFSNHAFQAATGQTAAEIVGQPLDQVAPAWLQQRYSIPFNNDAQLAVYARPGEPEGLSDLEQARDRLMSRIAHEIRTPLTSILGFAHMLVTKPDAPIEKRQKWSAFVQSKSTQLDRIVENMLDLSSAQTEGLRLNISTVSLSDLLIAAVDELTAMEPDRLVNLNIPANIPNVAIDFDRLAWVFNNMLTYGATATPAGTAIDVEIRVMNEQIEARVVERGRRLHPEEREAAFKPFSGEPGAGPQPGKGLWLPLARVIVEAHGGRMWIDAAPEGGNAFIFSLPKGNPAPNP